MLRNGCLTHRTLVTVALLLLGLAAHAGAQSADPVIGTWTLNLAKSKYASGPAPKSETRTYTAAGKDIKATSKGVDAEGKPSAAEWTIGYDGKDHAISGNPDIDSLSFKRIDAYTTESTQKKSGKVLATATRVVSKDGKTMTLTTKGTNSKGQTYTDVEVFDKK